MYFVNSKLLRPCSIYVIRIPILEENLHLPADGKSMKTTLEVQQVTWMFQISIIIVTVGVILATLSRPSSSKNNWSVSARTPEELQAYTIGIVMLIVSLFCTGFLGLLQEETYRKYGPCWKEGIFYTVSGCDLRLECRQCSFWLACFVTSSLHLSLVRREPRINKFIPYSLK